MLEAAETLVQYTDCQADMALPALERMPEETARRTRLASRLYAELRLRDVPGLPLLPDDASSIYWRCPLWTSERDALRAWLTDRFIDTATSGLLCASREPAFFDLAAETPHAFRFIDEMPKTPAGKVNRKVLRDRAKLETSTTTLDGTT